MSSFLIENLLEFSFMHEFFSLFFFTFSPKSDCENYFHFVLKEFVELKLLFRRRKVIAQLGH